MRMIDADALKENLSKSYDSLRKLYDGLIYNSEKAVCSGQLATFLEAIMLIMEAPTIDAEPVKHGQWEKRKDVIGFVRCSVCHDCNIYDDWADGKKWSYCPNCGAKMEVEQ